MPQKSFQKELAWRLWLSRVTVQELALEFSASIPTVSQWLAGTNEPHPIMQKPILKWLDSQIKA